MESALDTTRMHAADLDRNAAFDAAVQFANGQSDAAIAILVARINASAGRCGPRIWLMLIDIYRIQGLRPAHDKIALFFADRFRVSPPSWSAFDAPTLQSEPGSGLRNVLLVEGSPDLISPERQRDFAGAARTANTCRIDLSRARFDADDGAAARQAAILLAIMRKARRITKSAVLMGETAMLHVLHDRIDRRIPDHAAQTPFWELALEILQWRGRAQEFDRLSSSYAELFEHCPVDYDPSSAIALAPEPEDAKPQRAAALVPDPDVIDANQIMAHIQSCRAQRRPAEIDMRYVRRMSFDAATALAEFLRQDAELPGDKPAQPVFTDVNTPLSTLLDASGVAAYAVIATTHAKLLSIAA